MNTKLLSLGCLLIAATFSLSASAELLFDFEDGLAGWAADWGLKEPLETSATRSRSGNKSLLVTHQFKPKDESVGFRIVFDPPRDFTGQAGFAGFTAWVNFPSGDGWEAQMYVHTGDDWKWCEGSLNKNLQPGWHRISIPADQIADPAAVRSIGIQIKNYKLQRNMKFYVDRVESVYDK